MLLTCPDCSGKVSDLAVACPQCGRPVQSMTAPPVQRTGAAFAGQPVSQPQVDPHPKVQPPPAHHSQSTLGRAWKRGVDGYERAAEQSRAVRAKSKQAKDPLRRSLIRLVSTITSAIALCALLLVIWAVLSIPFKTCTSCGGRGGVLGMNCRTCGGDGKLTLLEIIKDR